MMSCFYRDLGTSQELLILFFFTDPASTEIYTLSLHDALPISLDLLCRLAGGLAVGDLRPAHVRVDLELAHQAVDDDLEVQLAHASDQRLAGLLVGGDAEIGRASCRGRGEASAGAGTVVVSVRQ